jgi:hypothetical protein
LGGNPKWLPLDLAEQAIATAGFVATFGNSPYNFGMVAEFEFRSSTVSVWFKDNKQETVDLLSRFCEEYAARDGDLTRAIGSALTTTGKAILFTATIMLFGILP